MRSTNNLARLVPLAIGVAVVGGVTWLLLQGASVLGTWLLAALILGHGLAHLAFVVPAPDPARTTGAGMPWPFDLGDSWLVTRFGLNPAIVRAAGRALVAVAVVTSLLAALATVGILVPAGWWPGLVVALAFGSALLLALAFSPMFVIGYGIDLALLWLVAASGWRPAP
jgi:hypothetical protein